MGVERSRRAHRRVIPYLSKEVLLEVHARRVGRESMQQRELLGGELDPLARERDLARRGSSARSPTRSAPRCGVPRDRRRRARMRPRSSA
jgi:hypothetical protein